MKKNMNIMATVILMAGLLVPTGAMANGRLGQAVDNAVQSAAIGAGVSVGVEVGSQVGRGIAGMIRGHEGKIFIGAVVLIAAYYIYSNREEAKANKSNQRRQAKSCTKKGCSHKGCK